MRHRPDRSNNVFDRPREVESDRPGLLCSAKEKKTFLHNKAVLLLYYIVFGLESRAELIRHRVLGTYHARFVKLLSYPTDLVFTALVDLVSYRHNNNINQYILLISVNSVS